VLAAAVSRDNMVQGKLFGFLATVLAGVVVAAKNAKASKLYLRSRALNHAL
jgi:hypothetical protein